MIWQPSGNWQPTNLDTSVLTSLSAERNININIKRKLDPNRAWTLCCAPRTIEDNRDTSIIALPWQRNDICNVAVAKRLTLCIMHVSVAVGLQPSEYVYKR